LVVASDHSTVRQSMGDSLLPVASSFFSLFP
jgi:hypothetical protein